VDTNDAHASCHEILEQPFCQAEADVDVLFFGAMTHARQTLCDKVDAEMSRLELHGRPVSHQCISGVFGAELECSICKAKVIYSDHSRPNAVLEVHRINPLLALGKAVVSASSSDNVLDAIYGGALKLLASEDIPEAISSLLLNDDTRFELEHRAYDHAQKMKLEAQPHVCRALTELASIARENAMPRGRQGLQNYVPYFAERRLTMDNMSNSSNSSNSTLGENYFGNMSSIAVPVTSTPPPTPIHAPDVPEQTLSTVIV